MEIKLNLLSEAKKNEVHRKNRYRFIVWQEAMLIFLSLFYMGILTGIYYMLTFQYNNLESTAISQGQNQTFQEINNAEQKFKTVNDKIAETMNFQREHITWSKFFIALDTVVPHGILLEKMVTVDRKISLSGKADTRDTLLQFQSNLNTTDCFQNADVPLADLFTQNNIDFQIDVEIQQQCLKNGAL
jgi:Tfp pilus assembly protein PilN